VAPRLDFACGGFHNSLATYDDHEQQLHTALHIGPRHAGAAAEVIQRAGADKHRPGYTDLAVDRTLMAADRSLMAWIRTALSMISFGYTIYKVLEGFQHEGSMQIRAHMPRNMGLFLTGLGTAAMLMGTTEYWMRLKSLRRAKPYRVLQPSLVMALVMSVAGLFIFLGIVFRTV
jgi:putative membrane protein